MRSLALKLAYLCTGRQPTGSVQEIMPRFARGSIGASAAVGEVSRKSLIPGRAALSHLFHSPRQRGFSLRLAALRISVAATSGWPYGLRCLNADPLNLNRLRPAEGR